MEEQAPTPPNNIVIRCTGLERQLLENILIEIEVNLTVNDDGNFQTTTDFSLVLDTQEMLRFKSFLEKI